MTVSRLLIVATCVFAALLHVSFEGFRQRHCLTRIYRLEREISLARRLVAAEKSSFQRAIFDVHRGVESTRHDPSEPDGGLRSVRVP